MSSRIKIKLVGGVACWIVVIGLLLYGRANPNSILLRSALSSRPVLVENPSRHLHGPLIVGRTASLVLYGTVLLLSAYRDYCED